GMPRDDDPSLKQELGKRHRYERRISREVNPNWRMRFQPILDRRSERLAPLIDRLSYVEKSSELGMPLLKVLPSYVHMSQNRWLKLDGGYEELMVYDSLRRDYRSCLNGGQLWV